MLTYICAVYMPKNNKPLFFFKTEKCHLLSSSANSSGFHSEPRSDPSPPLSSHLSESCPTTTGMFFGPLGKDEGINADDDMENSPEPKRKRSLVG